MYIPLGGSKKKLLNVWVIFTFVAIWHDLEWYVPFIVKSSILSVKVVAFLSNILCLIILMDFRKLLSWAWLTCLFFIPELVFKSAAKAFQVMHMHIFLF